jgi:tetratricopeptide (TPR) repeat protein
MIVKDEEEMLPGCLEAVVDGVDELIVVDTGSTDRTVEIAESFGARVVHFPWNGSFSDARNVSLEHCTGEWVLYLDADEHLMPGDALKLRQLVQRTWREAFYLSETNYTGGDELGAAVNHLALRLFRNRPEYRFEGRIHEQKTHNMPRFLPERFEVAPVRIRHYGYLKSRISAKDKSRRNLELLEQEARENPSPFNSFNIGSEYLNLGEWERSAEYLDRAWDEVRELDDWLHVPYTPSLATRMVLARRGTGDLDGARRGVHEALAAFPAHTDLVFELALVEKDAGNLAEAARLAERCLEMGDAPEQYAPTVGAGTYLSLCLLADVHRAEGRKREAVALLERALAEHPDYLGPVFPLATLLLAGGATPAEALAAVPAEKPSARLLVATALYEAGHAAEAEDSFCAVLEKQPANGAARIGLLEALLSQGRFEDAAREAAAEPAESPVAALAAVELLFALAALGDADRLAEAIVLAEGAGARAHELELYRGWRDLLAGGAPGFVSADAARAGLVALEALLRVRAFDAFGTLLPLLDRSALPGRERQEALASLYLRRGYLDSAAETWVAVVEAAPDAAAFVGLSQVALAGGAPEDAAQFAATALELDPDNVPAARLREAAQARLERVMSPV